MNMKYELAGKGPVKVIAIHDWMSTLRSYDAIRPYLDEATFQYAFVDMRGYGCNQSILVEHSAV